MVSSTFYSFKTLVWQRQCYMILFHYIFLGHRGRSAFLWLRNIRLGSDHENDHECDISKYGDKILHANHLKSVFPFCHNLACYIWRWWHLLGELQRESSNLHQSIIWTINWHSVLNHCNLKAVNTPEPSQS